MNRLKGFIVFGALVVLASLAVTTVSANEYYLNQDDSSVPDYGNTTEVGIWVNATESITSGFFNLTYTCCCANITQFTPNTTVFDVYPGMACGFINLGFDKWSGGTPVNVPAAHYHLGNITIHCCDETPPCETDLHFTEPILVWFDSDQMDFPELVVSTNNGTFECGTGTPPPVETFSKHLSKGWNLISLPLVPEDNSASAVLSTVSYDAAYRYDATSKQFESIESADAMNSGTGYFVYATEDCTWEYSGTPHTSMDVSLKQGLNMVGWLNCSKNVGDVLSPVSNYYYVARWDATAEKFEVHNPMAPAASFHDFTAMDRGTGYFISAKQDCTLSESC
jgi:hypothetical protein